MVSSSPSSSIPFCNNQSISQTAALEEETQFSQSLHPSQLDDKIKSVTAGLQDHFAKLLKKQSSQNVETIADYILALNIEVNPSIH